MSAHSSGRAPLFSARHAGDGRRAVRGEAAPSWRSDRELTSCRQYSSRSSHSAIVAGCPSADPGDLCLRMRMRTGTHECWRMYAHACKGRHAKSRADACASVCKHAYACPNTCLLHTCARAREASCARRQCWGRRRTVGWGSGQSAGSAAEPRAAKGRHAKHPGRRTQRPSKQANPQTTNGATQRHNKHRRGNPGITTEARAAATNAGARATPET